MVPQRDILCTSSAFGERERRDRHHSMLLLSEGASTTKRQFAATQPFHFHSHSHPSIGRNSAILSFNVETCFFSVTHS